MSARVCRVEGCGATVNAYGLCRSHRRQQMRGEDFKPAKRLPKRHLSAAERLALRSEVDESTGCVLWLGARNTNGYGQIQFRGRLWQAHILAYVSVNGPVPEGLVLDHKCRVKACVNVAHLHAVTPRQNAENQTARRHSGTGIRGVHWSKQRRKWVAAAATGGVKKIAGYFDDIAEAERAVITLRNQMYTNNLNDRTGVSDVSA